MLGTRHKKCAYNCLQYWNCYSVIILLIF